MAKATLRLWHRLATDNRAATAVEYGLIIAMIVIAMISALKGFASVTTDMWNNVADQVGNASEK